MDDYVDPIDDPAVRQQMVDNLLKTVGPIEGERPLVLRLADDGEAARLIREHNLLAKMQGAGLVVEFIDVAQQRILIDEAPSMSVHIIRIMEEYGRSLVRVLPPRTLLPSEVLSKREIAAMDRKRFQTAVSRVPTKHTPRPRPRMSARKR